MRKIQRFVFITALPFLLLSACNATKPSKPSISTVSKEKQESAPLPQKDETAVIQEKILAAKADKDWPSFVAFAEQLWGKADSSNQAAIEYQIFHNLKQLPAQEQARLMARAKANKNIALSDWLTLVDIEQQAAIWHKTQLQDLKVFNETALYQHHLLPELLTHTDVDMPAKHIGVLLPFSGAYAKVGKQIRDGIIKHQLENYPKLVVRFYDSADLTQLNATYDLAVKEGANQIIGPLTKKAIATLSEHQAKDMIVLNRVKNTPFTQFSFKSLSEASQISAQLEYREHKNIGILTSDKNQHLKLAQSIHYSWSESAPDHFSNLATYDRKKHKLRKALGGLIHENKSKERYNNLRWLLNKKLTFTPRSRQDLDAILFIDKADTVAVFKPQLKFFDLNLPVYASSSISPSDFSNPRLHKDLYKTIFPTSNAVLKPGKVNSAFEAFGWDSLTIALQADNIQPGLCFNQGQKGRLTQLENNLVDAKLIWATFDREGRVVPLPTPKYRGNILPAPPSTEAPKLNNAI